MVSSPVLDLQRAPVIGDCVFDARRPKPSTGCVRAVIRGRGCASSSSRSGFLVLAARPRPWTELDEPRDRGRPSFATQSRRSGSLPSRQTFPSRSSRLPCASDFGIDVWWSATTSHWSLNTGRAGRAAIGVGFVVGERPQVVCEVEQLVLTDHDLLHLPARVLDNVDALADRDLSLRRRSAGKTRSRQVGSLARSRR